MAKHFAIASLLLCLSTAASGSNRFTVGLGVLSHDLGRISQNQAGETSTLGTNYFNLHMQGHVPLADSTFFSPQIIYMPSALFPHKSPDGKVVSNYFILGLPFTLAVAPPGGYWGGLDFEIGPAIMNYTITGKGGTVTLNNGNSTAVFAIPSRTQTTRTIALEMGFVWTQESYRLALETLTEGLLSNQRRTYSIMVSLQFHAFEI